ncbi:MAG: guanylate kinase [Synergistaceae bacterium]|nr:guanylate kinase [Synergistaceae bacterium]
MCREDSRTSSKHRVGSLFVLSGPSGVGKGTLREHALNNIANLVYSISCTTRQPRPGETDGVEYRFISHEKFKQDISENLFLEYAHVHNDYYGTLKADVESALNSGHDVLLEIDVQGALQVREKMPQAVLIFIAPPSVQELERRLTKRNTESQEVIRTRLNNALRELELQDKYNHVIINDDLERASQELRNIIMNNYES